MQKNFLTDLFTFMKIPQIEHPKLSKALAKVLKGKIAETLWRKLSTEQRKLFHNYMKRDSVDTSGIQQWIKENGITFTEETIEDIKDTYKKTLREFFSILFFNLDSIEKQKLMGFINSYNI